MQVLTIVHYLTIFNMGSIKKVMPAMSHSINGYMWIENLTLEVSKPP